MNRISRYIIVAFSAVVTLVSCTKEQVGGPEGNGLLPQGQVREIAVSFGESTKSVLGTDTDHKYKPAFCVGDRIKVSNATRSEDCVVADADGVLKIFTNLSGELTAVYPSTAANLTGTDSAPINTSSGARPYKVSSTQSGKFSDANICTATIDADDTAVSFENQTALLRFYVDESIGVQKITITGTADIATEGTDKKVITVDPEGTALISTVTEDPDKRLCYVAILPGANTLTFESVTTVQGQETVSNTMKTGFNYAQNGIYNAFIPYYIKIHIGPGENDCQKWAYCNLGAFLPEEYGKYYAWGDINGQTWSGTGWSNGGFCWATAPFNYGQSTYNSNFTTQIPDVCPQNVLVLTFDAAYRNLGESWRMPTGGTGGEFKILKNATYWKWDVDDKGYYIYLPQDGDAGKANGESTNTYNKEDAKLFLPAAGRGDSATTRQNAGSLGRYWTSTLSPYVDDGYYNGRVMGFENQTIGTNIDTGNVRSQGSSIRALYIDPADLSINPYIDDDVIIK